MTAPSVLMVDYRQLLLALGLPAGIELLAVRGQDGQAMLYIRGPGVPEGQMLEARYSTSVMTLPSFDGWTRLAPSPRLALDCV